MIANRFTVTIRVLFILFIVAAFTVRPGITQTVRTLEIDFIRATAGNGTADTACGTVYYWAPDTVKLKVTRPVRQLMTFNGNKTLIYYPDDKRAFEITSQSPSNLPFFDAFIGMIETDYGLTKMGYTIDHHETRGDTLLIYWNPPEAAIKMLGQYLLKLVDNKLIYAESRDSKNAIIAKSIYADHTTYGASSFALTINTTRYEEADSTMENVIFANPRFNQPMPDDAINLHIPDDIEIEKLEW